METTKQNQKPLNIKEVLRKISPKSIKNAFAGGCEQF